MHNIRNIFDRMMALSFSPNNTKFNRIRTLNIVAVWILNVECRISIPNSLTLDPVSFFVMCSSCVRLFEVFLICAGFTHCVNLCTSTRNQPAPIFLECNKKSQRCHRIENEHTHTAANQFRLSFVGV